MNWLRTQTTGLYNTWSSVKDTKNMKLFLGEKWYLDLPDGDRLCLLVNVPNTAITKDDVIVVVHGLAGAATDPSVVHIAEKFLSEGHIVVRVNLRGSGHGAGLAKNIYHAGHDIDFESVVAAVAERFNDKRVVLVGMSLSCNMMFRYLAKNLDAPVSRALALSPVVDLPIASQKLSHAYLGMINKSVLSFLKSYFVKRKRAFADTTVPDWDRIKKFYEFDELYIAPLFGFKSVADYYSSTTALPLIGDVKTPWTAVLSLDDPIAVSEKRIFKKKFAKNTIVLPSGGHLYFKKYGGLGEVAYKVFSQNNNS
ncbi:MAG: alpha/beta fold hydrolase [Bdellovibrionota bacterium]